MGSAGVTVDGEIARLRGELERLRSENARLSRLGARHPTVRRSRPTDRVRPDRQRHDHQGRDHRPLHPPIRQGPLNVLSCRRSCVLAHHAPRRQGCADPSAGRVGHGPTLHDDHLVSGLFPCSTGPAEGSNLRSRAARSGPFAHGPYHHRSSLNCADPGRSARLRRVPARARVDNLRCA